MIVYVTIWSHRHGEDVGAYATAAGAEAWRQAIAAEEWDNEIPETVPKPQDPKKLADCYFEFMGDNFRRSEFFSVQPLTVQE